MKRWFKQLHLALALLAGVFLISISVSGALLVFGKDIQQLLQPTYWEINPPSQAPNITQVLNIVNSQLNHENLHIHQLSISNRPNWPWVLTLSNREQWNINPATGEVLYRYQQGSDFYHWIMRWHRWLLIEDQTLKPWLRHAMSTVSLILIIEIIVGLIMWLTPLRGMLKRLKLKPGRTWRARLHQYHLLAGIVFSLPLIAIAFTGMSFNWPTQKIFELATFSNMQARENNLAGSPGDLAKLAIAVDTAQQALPEAKIQRIYFPQKNEAPLLIRMQAPNEKAPFSYLWIDAGTGQLLTLYNSARAPSANQWWDFKYAFHTGIWFGKISQWLWLLMALLPALFTGSGLYLYYARWAQRQEKALSAKVNYNCSSNSRGS
ncbi:MAG: PepSY-associated TM helix domain-containing protein [Pseudomonadales bacterium]